MKFKSSGSEGKLAKMSSGEEQEDAGIRGPLVFSCSKCKIIVGDSFSFLTSNEELGSITLTAASNIQRSADVYTSKTGGDVGSTYFSFTCIHCQAPLGRYYLTTSRDLDDLREKFTFTCDGISSYELGKSQHGKMPDPIAVDSSMNAGGAQGTGVASADVAQTVASLNEEVFKIQHVFVGMLQRLEAVEQRVGIASSLAYAPPPPQHAYRGSGSNGSVAAHTDNAKRRR